MAPKFCSKCGAPLIEGKAFCTKCGTQIHQVKDNDVVVAGLNTTVGEKSKNEKPANPTLLKWIQRIGIIVSIINVVIMLELFLSSYVYGSWAMFQSEILIKNSTRDMTLLAAREYFSGYNDYLITIIFIPVCFVLSLFVLLFSLLQKAPIARGGLSVITGAMIIFTGAMILSLRGESWNGVVCEGHSSVLAIILSFFTRLFFLVLVMLNTFEILKCKNK